MQSVLKKKEAKAKTEIQVAFAEQMIKNDEKTLAFPTLFQLIGKWHVRKG